MKNGISHKVAAASNPQSAKTTNIMEVQSLGLFLIKLTEVTNCDLSSTKELATKIQNRVI